MKIEFDSIEEVLAFAAKIQPINPMELALDICRVKNNKFAAIKVLRAVTHTDLKTAKEAIEAYWNQC